MKSKNNFGISFDNSAAVLTLNFLTHKMKKNTLFVFGIATLGLFACKNPKEGETETPKVDSLEVVTPPAPKADEIVMDSLTNKEGKMLKMLFNNTQSTATFTFENETIEMKQDTTASGIQYSNEHFVFTEWQGQVDLKKDGKSIFTHKK